MFDLNLDELPKNLKKIDPSDIRVLVVGLVLLLMPILFLAWSGGVAQQGGFSREEAQTRLVGGRGGFSFVDHAKGSGAVTTPSGGSSLLGAPKAENEWESVLRSIAETPPAPVDLSGAPASTRAMFEAQYHPKLIRAQFLLNKDQNDQAEEILKEILNEDIDNPFLKYSSSMLLCELYDRTGRAADLQKELARMFELMGSLTKGGGMADSIKKGFPVLQQMPTILSKFENDPALTNNLQQFLEQRKIMMTVPEFVKSMKSQMPMVPGLPTQR